MGSLMAWKDVDTALRRQCSLLRDAHFRSHFRLADNGLRLSGNRVNQELGCRNPKPKRHYGKKQARGRKHCVEGAGADAGMSEPER